MKAKMAVKIILMYNDKREAEAVTRAVSPDNVKTPPYLAVATARSRCKVITRIICEEYRLGTFISTIDDVLSSVSVAERTCLSIKRLR